MSDTVDSYLLRRQPTAARPLLGLTVLLVEDSRFASEAVRLMCLRSGARIRRADCIEAAHRHMRSYRPSVVIVDLGLPDGPGEDLIAELVAAENPGQVLIATSGDPDGATRAAEAGAPGFIEKPVKSLGAFQQAVLAQLPPESRPLGLRSVPEETVTPDPIAFADDMAHVAELLPDPEDEKAAPCPVDYIAQFVTGVARAAGDASLSAAADALTKAQAAGGASRRDLDHLSHMIRRRLGASAVI